MKIAVIAVGYNCRKNFAEIMQYWFAAKYGMHGYEEKPKLENVEFTISATTALFKEYADLGQTYDNDETEKILLSFNKTKYIDYLNIIKEPILDYQSRVAAWDSIKHIDFDYVWQLDLADEYYTYEEIRDTCNWLIDNNLNDFYRINFKNYFGKLEDKTYVLDFKPVRIINNKMRGGIDNFYWDNDIVFKDGTKTPYCAGGVIPIRICNPRHLSWVGDKQFLKTKIEYQKRALGVCSYKYNDVLDKLEFDIDYYNKYNNIIPHIYNGK